MAAYIQKQIDNPDKPIKQTEFSALSDLIHSISTLNKDY